MQRTSRCARPPWQQVVGGHTTQCACAGRQGGWAGAGGCHLRARILQMPHMPPPARRRPQGQLGRFTPCFTDVVILGRRASPAGLAAWGPGRAAQWDCAKRHTREGGGGAANSADIVAHCYLVVVAEMFNECSHQAERHSPRRRRPRGGPHHVQHLAGVHPQPAAGQAPARRRHGQGPHRIQPCIRRVRRATPPPAALFCGVHQPCMRRACMLCAGWRI
jgi:hypothetical protein